MEKQITEEENIYWAYNLPLQVYPQHENKDDESSPVISTSILNYMPRKHTCEMLDLEECFDGLVREEFFNKAADILENLAKHMRKAAIDPSHTVYYPDEELTK